MKKVSADIAIIGSGLAGLSAAINAKESAPELEVVVCSKSKPGLANCTAVSQGFFRNSNPSYPPERHEKETIKSGYGLNNRVLVKVLAQNAAAGIAALEKYGVDFKERARGSQTFGEKNGQEGMRLIRPLLAYARSIGVKFIYPFFSWEIIKEGCRVCGIWGFAGKEQEPVIVEAPAVVLASGGAGSLYSRSDNPPGITGDGYAMAYRAGLLLVDMEFVQFYPLVAAIPGRGAKFLPALLADAGRFLNNLGEDLVEKYKIDKLPLAVASRDTLSRAIALEVFGNRGIEGAIKLEFPYGAEGWERAGRLRGVDNLEKFKTYVDKFAVEEGYLLVMPAAHFFIGGIIIDERCRTALEGLFAAGEVCGGLHGANRLGGNALAEAVVFGRIAGEEAKEHARREKLRGPAVSSALEKQVEAAFKQLLQHCEEHGKIDAEEQSCRALKKRIGELMWNKAGLIRSAESLQEAKAVLKEYQDSWSFKLGRNDIRTVLELKNMLLVAQVIVEAALVREESRGAHYRLDYPHLRKAWQQNIIVSSKGLQVRE